MIGRIKTVNVSRTVIGQPKSGPASVMMQRSADTGEKDALAAMATRCVQVMFH